jgi:hypothetical protein
MVSVGDEILVEREGSTKPVVLERVAPGIATVLWPTVGPFDVELQGGEVLSHALPHEGVFEVDTATGRVRGTRFAVAPEDLVQLELFQAGDSLRLTHDGGRMFEVSIVDSLPSEGTLKIWVQTEQRTYPRHRTGWRVSSATLRALQQMQKAG